MKAIFKTLGKFLMTVALLCPTVTFAQSNLPKDFTAHWVSTLDENTRLCDLSIPEAHDAATWSVSELNLLGGYYKDQKFDEKTLFSMGVRAFDMRFNVESFNHGPIVLSQIKDEINEHFPSKEDLKGEFMVLFFQFENSIREASDENKVLGFQRFIDNLVDKYGDTTFIQFRKDLTVKDVRGKIILVATGNDYNPHMLTHNKVPVATQKTGTKVYKETYSDGRLIGYDKNGFTLWEPTAQFFEQNNFDASRKDKKKAIKIGLEGDGTGKFEGWFNFLKRSDENKECVFHKAQISSYDMIDNGGDICADGKESRGRGKSPHRFIGCNHYTYNLLKNYDLPYGFVRFDFIGEKVHEFYDCYGDKLLDRILLNNTYIPFVDGTHFIKDFTVARSRNLDNAKKMLEKDGNKYYFCHANYGAPEEIKYLYLFSRQRDKNRLSYPVIGYKHTNDINEAVTDVVIYKSEPKTAFPETIKVDGHTYKRAASVEDINDNWIGDLNTDNTDLGGKELVLYYTKERLATAPNRYLSGIKVVLDEYTDIDRCAKVCVKQNESECRITGVANLNDGVEDAKVLRLELKWSQCTEDNVEVLEENIADETEDLVKEPLTRAGDFEDEVFNDSDDDNLPADVQPILYNDGNMLYVENCDDNAIFNVYDVSGKVVAHATTAPIEISHLKKGIYVLDINGKGYKFVKK